MGTFEIIEKQGEHEQIVFCSDKSAHLKAIIAIHDTTLGPALGGTRMWPYANEDDALVDVLRLSRGMTYKAAAAGLNLGGGKAVIIGDPKTQKSEALFRAFGQFVNSLNGRYITAEDVGTGVKDMEYVFMETPWVTGIPQDMGGSGDPSPYTAHGVLMGIKAAAKWKLGSDSLRDVRVAVQGLGNVGSNLVRYLSEEGAKIVVADLDPAKVKACSEKYKVTVVDIDQILQQECEILAPCALGSVINDKTIGKLKCKIVAGGANNQLAEPRHGDQLSELGILYAPDFVVNAGGLMNVFVELEGYSAGRSLDKTRHVYDSCIRVFEIAKRDGIGTHKAADRMAEERIKTLGQLRSRHPGNSSRVFTTLREVFKR